MGYRESILEPSIKSETAWKEFRETLDAFDEYIDDLNPEQIVEYMISLIEERPKGLFRTFLMEELPEREDFVRRKKRGERTRKEDLDK